MPRNLGASVAHRLGTAPATDAAANKRGATTDAPWLPHPRSLGARQLALEWLPLGLVGRTLAVPGAEVVIGFPPERPVVQL